MNKHGFLFGATMAVLCLALATAGCQQDPEKNSRIFGGGAGSGGSTGTGGGGMGMDGGGGSSPNGIPGTPIATFETGVEGSALDTYHEPPSTGKVNLGDP